MIWIDQPPPLKKTLKTDCKFEIPDKCIAGDPNQSHFWLALSKPSGQQSNKQKHCCLTQLAKALDSVQMIQSVDHPGSKKILTQQTTHMDLSFDLGVKTHFQDDL